MYKCFAPLWKKCQHEWLLAAAELSVLTVCVCSVSVRPASVERKPPELSTLNDGYQIRIWSPPSPHSPPRIRPRTSQQLTLKQRLLPATSVTGGGVSWQRRTRERLRASRWTSFTRSVATNPRQTTSTPTDTAQSCSSSTFPLKTDQRTSRSDVHFYVSNI